MSFMDPAQAGRSMAHALAECLRDGTLTREEYDATVARASTVEPDLNATPEEAALEPVIVAAFIAEHARITA